MMRYAAIKVVSAPPRLMTKGEAADYCARSVTRFTAECPVQPLIFANGDRRYDIRDIDQWIDSLKASHVTHTADEIMERLG